jgi:hypothetical protein
MSASDSGAAVNWRHAAGRATRERDEARAEVERLRAAIKWYVEEREKYLRSQPTAGLDHAWEGLRACVR